MRASRKLRTISRDLHQTELPRNDALHPRRLGHAAGGLSPAQEPRRAGRPGRPPGQRPGAGRPVLPRRQGAGLPRIWECAEPGLRRHGRRGRRQRLRALPRRWRRVPRRAPRRAALPGHGAGRRGPGPRRGGDLRRGAEARAARARRRLGPALLGARRRQRGAGAAVLRAHALRPARRHHGFCIWRGARAGARATRVDERRGERMARRPRRPAERAAVGHGRRGRPGRGLPRRAHRRPS